MSHTFDWEDDRPNKELGAIWCPDDHQVIHIHYNSDYSGDAFITVPEATFRQIMDSMTIRPAIHYEGQMVSRARGELRLPAALLAAFSRAATIHEAIGALQDLA
jgi:hypothetical protein